jgi:UMF1 family MFS transporter
MTPRSARAPWSEIFGWAMFDFANSSYTTVIITVVYAVVFPRLIVGDGPEFRQGNLLWSATLAVSYLLVVVTVPVLGALLDRTGHKKRWLAASWLFTVVTTAALAFVQPGDVALAMTLLVLSNYGFSIGESFAASFLPDLAPPEEVGKISGLAWGLGYVGGLVSTATVIFGLGPQTPENFDAMRWVGPITGAFFFVAALPTFLLVRERAMPAERDGDAGWAAAAFGQVWATARALPSLRDLAMFFASYFFAMAGLSIVVAFAFIYGDQVIGWSAASQTAMFVLTQITAAGGALAFGTLQARWGNVRTYQLTLVLWMATVALIAGAVPLAGALGVEAETLFLGVGALAGTCLGATQSAARTIVALFAPAEQVGEMFGLWGLFGKLAAVFGLLALGALQAALGLQNAILVCGLFYLAALALGAQVDEARALRRVATEPPAP